jgi:hypothetical protein
MRTFRKALKTLCIPPGLRGLSQAPLSAVNMMGEWPWKLKLHGGLDTPSSAQLDSGAH